MKLQTFLLVLFTLTFAVSSANAQDIEDLLVFATDFESGADSLPEELIRTPDWEISTATIDGVARSVLSVSASEDNASSITLIPDEAWTDYSVEMRLAVSGNGFFAVSLRQDFLNEDCRGGYDFLYFSEDQFGTIATSVGDECGLEFLESGPIPTIPDSEFFLLSVAAIGDQITVSVNQEQILTTTDSGFTEGLPTILVSGMEAQIDLVAVLDYTLLETDTVAEAENEVEPTVEPEPEPLALTLENYDGRPAEAIGELQELEVLPEGGRLLFQEPVAFFQGAGNWFTPLAQSSRLQDVVIGGEVDFRSGTPDELESCAVLGRIIANNRGVVQSSLSVRFFNDGSLGIADSTDNEITGFRMLPRPVDLEEPRHIILVAIGDTVSLYLDGELVLSDVEVEAKDGYFGVGLTGAAAASRCEVRNLWVYNFD